MSIKTIDHGYDNIFGFEVSGKLTADEVEKFSPIVEKAVVKSEKRLRLLIDVTGMDKAEVKAEWDIFEFLKRHLNDIEYIAIVGAHSWTKFMSEILAGSIFVEAETRYFKPEEKDDAWLWLSSSSHPSHIPLRRVIDSDKGLFTKYSSPDYI